MLIEPITMDNKDGNTVVGYRSTVYYKSKFVGVFENPTRLLVIKNALLRIDIMEMLKGKRMDGGTTVQVQCCC